jgi:hypothetical protein
MNGGEGPSISSGPSRRGPRNSAALSLERVATAARRLSEFTMARGDWIGAADVEEQAIVAEHKAALLRG